MARFAYCDSTGTIWQVDTANPSKPAFPVHDGESHIWSIAFTSDKQFQLVWGPSQKEIRRTKGTQTDAEVYKHPMWLGAVRVRSVSGAERVYFSARKSETTGIYEIYQLKNNAPVLYLTIDPKQLTFPNPCDETSDLFFYSGDFAFDEGNTLYLSSGAVSSSKPTMKVGVYRNTGAGPDTVTGSVERIYLGEGPIEALCYQSPLTLYFLRNNEVRTLNLNTLTETLEGSIKVVDPKLHPRDLAFVKEGLVPTWWFGFIKALKELLGPRADAFESV